MLPSHLSLPMWMRAAVGFVVLLIATVALHAAVSDIVEVKFDEWMTPSVRPFPHDPAGARDGSVWYTGQLLECRRASRPDHRRFREYCMPTPDSGPHGLVEDPDGNIWAHGQRRGTDRQDRRQERHGDRSSRCQTREPAIRTAWCIREGD